MSVHLPPLRPGVAPLLAVALWGMGMPAQAEGERPRAAVVLLGEGRLGKAEVEALLNGAIDQMRASSGYELDPVRSLQAGSEATVLACALDYSCLLRVAEQTEVDAVLGIQAVPEGRRSLELQLLWVAADARGLPGESERRVARKPKSLEAAVRAGVKKVIPDYARAGRGGLTVLAEAGSDIQINGKPIGKAPMQQAVVLSAGVHRVDVLTPGGGRVSKSVVVVEARRNVVDLPSPRSAVAALTEKPAPAKGGALKTASFVVGGAGALALGGGVFFGLQARSLNEQVRAGACAGTPCHSGITQREAQTLYERANGRATLGNVGVTTGALMLVGAGVMYWLASDAGEDAR